MFAYARPEKKPESMNAEQKKDLTNRLAAPNQTDNTDTMKMRFEDSSRISPNGILVHYNSEKSAQMKAFAHMQINHVYVAPGQEKYLGCELDDVVQQKQKSGVLTKTDKSNNIEANDVIDNDNEDGKDFNEPWNCIRLPSSRPNARDPIVAYEDRWDNSPYHTPKAAWNHPIFNTNVKSGILRHAHLNGGNYNPTMKGVFMIEADRL